MSDSAAVRVRELTALGRGGVSVLEVRGPAALERVQALVPSASIRVGDFRLVRLIADGELLDEALVWAADSERVELHVHASPPLVRRVRAELDGTRSPAPAELPRELSLEQRALECLSAAPCEAAARVLLDQAEGALRRELERLRDLLGDASSSARDIDAGLESLAGAGQRAVPLIEPRLVVLAGPVNAGKSTLFNLLVGHERVVVDALRGTTRDPIQERVRIRDYAIDLVDTAGDGEPDAGGTADRRRAADVEREGQALGRALRGRAHLVLRLCPSAALSRERGRELGAPAGSGTPECRLSSRADERVADGERNSEWTGSVASISAREEPEAARVTVANALYAALELAPVPWSAGAPVPFDTESRELVQRLRKARVTRAARISAIESALAR